MPIPSRDRVDVTIEGAVDYTIHDLRDDFSDFSGYRRAALARKLTLMPGERYAVVTIARDSKVVAKPGVPTWKPGDVVVVHFGGPSSTPFTYVRGSRVWPGERAGNKTDADITAWFREGKVAHVMRDGKAL